MSDPRTDVPQSLLVALGGLGVIVAFVLALMLLAFWP
jgi:hypothetical protein